ncbi:hypothetical protein TUBRATIS_22610, partial [Tubulinosema ratisbonensis]
MLPYVFSAVEDLDSINFDLIRDLELEMPIDSIINFYGVINDLKDQDDQIKKDSLPCDYEIKKGDDSKKLLFTYEKFFRKKKKARIEEKTLNLEETSVLEKRFC